jgi:two-component system response regulator NreC
MLLESTNKYQVILEAGNGQEVIEALDNGVIADLIISDIGMPVMDGIEMVRKVTENHPGTPVLIMSMMEDDTHLYQAVGAGAKGFLTKSVDADELFFSIKKLLSGERYICSCIAVKLLDRIIETELSPVTKMLVGDFSQREIEILQLIGQGMTNAEMADKLFISRRTVEGHRQTLIDKTGVKNTAMLMRYAYSKGIID